MTRVWTPAVLATASTSSRPRSLIARSALSTGAPPGSSRETTASIPCWSTTRRRRNPFLSVSRYRWTSPGPSAAATGLPPERSSPAGQSRSPAAGGSGPRQAASKSAAAQASRAGLSVIVRDPEAVLLQFAARLAAVQAQPVRPGLRALQHQGEIPLFVLL